MRRQRLRLFCAVLVASLSFCVYAWVTLVVNGSVDALAALLMGTTARAWGKDKEVQVIGKKAAAAKFVPPAHCLQADSAVVTVSVPEGGASDTQTRYESAMRRACASHLLQPDACASALGALRSFVTAAEVEAAAAGLERVPAVALSFRAVYSTVQSIKIDMQDEELSLTPNTDVDALAVGFCREKNLYEQACGALTGALRKKYEETFCRAPSAVGVPVQVQGSW